MRYLIEVILGPALATLMLFGGVDGCAQPCRFDTDCGEGALCSGSFCEAADTSRSEGQWCDGDGDCAPDERCTSTRCILRGTMGGSDGGPITTDGGGSDGGIDGGGGGDGGSITPPNGICDNLSLDDVYFVGSVPQIGPGLMSMKFGPTAYCVAAFANSGVIRGSDGRLVYRNGEILGGKALSFTPDSVRLLANGQREYVSRFENDVEIPTPPCDAPGGSLVDIRLNPSDWSLRQKCGVSDIFWHDETGAEVAGHWKYGYQDSTLDLIGSSATVGTATGNFTLLGSDLGGGRFFLRLARALSTGFLVVEDDGKVPLRLWDIQLDGSYSQLGSYAALPPAFLIGPQGGQRAMSTTGDLYFVGPQANGSMSILRLAPDGSPAEVVYDRDALEALYGKDGYWVQARSPRVLITGP